MKIKVISKQNYIILTIASLLCNFLLKAQEMITDLSTNSTLEKAYALQKQSLNKTNVLIDTIALPFVDDFSKPVVYPDTSLWLDNFVFINTNYGINPPTLGIATLEGLAANGKPYNFTTNAHGIADYLTSKPIDLNYPASDSIYLSFFYQPQGRGNAPETNDSLILEFKTPEKDWTKVWYKNGSPIGNNSVFKQVMIAVNSEEYLKKGFQFRFKNWANLSGNIDHWHLDYIKLDKGRTIADTLYDDVAFISSSPSLLQGYQNVPWRQYNPDIMVGSLQNSIINLSATTKHASYQYTIRDKQGNILYNYDGGTAPINPYITSGYHTYAAHAVPPLNYSFPALQECSEYTITHTLKADADTNHCNDTLHYIQYFTDYFAYDDGSAEAAYGITQVNGKIAYKFILENPDTLKALRIYFNPFINDGSQYGFKITVWSNDPNNNIPSSILYQQSSVSLPVYGEGYNAFKEYALDAPLPLQAGVFYVGWTQLSENSLNVGLDFNFINTNKMFFNVNGTWYNSQFAGSWMIRPVFGSCPNYVNGEKRQPTSSFFIETFPNPVSEKLYIKTNLAHPFNAYLIDMTGRILINQPNSREIDVSLLPNGIYFLKVENKTQETFITKKITILR